MRQISSLQKGLIFNPDLSEWGQGRDLVSGVIPTNIAVYPVLDSRGNGRRWLDFNGASSYVALPTQPVFGTGDFTVIRRVKVGTIGAIRTLIGGAANSFEMYISATGYLTALKNGGSALTASTTLLTAGSIVSLGYSRSGTTGTYYIDGVAAGTCTDSNNYSVATTLGGNGTGFFNGSDVMTRCFNYALTTAQVINYSKPEYAIEWVDRGATGTVLTSGTIVTGKKYLIKTYVASDVFTNVGAASNATGVIFTATGTTPTTWSNSSQLVQLGCILDLNAEGMNASTWVDKTNSLTATNSGTTFVLPSASNLRAMFYNGAAKLVFGNILNSGDLTFAFRATNHNAGYILSMANLQIWIESGQVLRIYRNIISSSVDTGYNFHINSTNTAIITSDSLGNTTIYLDGVKIVSGTITIAGNTSQMYLGCKNDSTNYFNGKLSSFAIWNRILNPDDIALVNSIL